MRARAHRRGGFALVAALWLLVALGAVGLDAALQTRARRLTAANILDEARARAAAVAGTEYARSRLTWVLTDLVDQQLRSDVRSAAGNSPAAMRDALRRTTRMFSDPTEDPWRDPEGLMVLHRQFGDAEFTLRLEDTGLRLHLNEATEEMIRQFLAQGMRVDYALSDRITQTILDWRDEDDIPRLNGGEREQYVREGAPMLPTNRPFASVDELRYILGMTAELYTAIRPYLTVTGSGRVNINAAPEPVLLALPGITPAAATEILRLRAAGLPVGNTRELRDMNMMPASTALALVERPEQLNDHIVFTTTEIEIVAEGAVRASFVRSRVRLVVARASAEAVPVSYRVDDPGT